MADSTNDPVLSLYLNGYLNTIMDKKPLLKREWEVEDFRQELSMNYLRKVSAEKRQSLGKEHESSLLKRMAVQLSKDKLRQLQRKKRDCRRSFSNFKEDLPSQESSVLEKLCTKESLDMARTHLKDEMWSVFCMRNNGLDWRQIAKLMNKKNPDALRMKFYRTIKVISDLMNKE